MKLTRPAICLFMALTLVLALLLFADLSRQPKHQFTVNILVFSIEKYHEYVTPHLKGAVACKFTPTCSAYAMMALKKHGAFKGTALTIARLAKCSPLSSAHGEHYP